jgi:hypothetical protein
VCKDCFQAATEDEKRKLKREEEEEKLKRKERKGQYVPIAKKPPAANLDRVKPMAFVVWASCGYRYDGFHSYHGPPKKKFDSSFALLAEANARVRYKFYEENPWGVSRSELEEDCGFGESTPEATYSKSGLLTLSISPADSETWTVSASLSGKRPYEDSDEDKDDNAPREEDEEDDEEDEEDLSGDEIAAIPSSRPAELLSRPSGRTKQTASKRPRVYEDTRWHW